MGSSCDLSVSPERTSEGENKNGRLNHFTQVGTRQTVFNFRGEQSYRISPLLPAKHPADLYYTTDLIVLWLFSLGVLSNSLFGRIKLAFSSPRTYVKKDKAFSFLLFFCRDSSVVFAESVIKARFFFLHHCHSLQSYSFT